MKKAIKLLQLSFIVLVVILGFNNKVSYSSEVNNLNVDRTVSLKAMAQKVAEYDYDTIYGAKDTYTGDLTGYAADCPLCTGHLACLSNYNVLDGTTTYPDETYGTVGIVASSSNLPCGTIIRFYSSKISDEAVYAIVLDRGVLGNAIDYLSPSEDYASSYIGRSQITYDVLRVGW